MALQPVNYGAQTGDALGSYFDTRGQLQGLRAGQQQAEAREFQLEGLRGQQQTNQQQQALQQQAADVFQTGNPDDIASFMIANPQMQDAMLGADKFRSERSKQSKIEAARNIVLGGDPSEELVKSARVIADEGGDPTDTLDMADQPDEVKKRASETLWASLDPQGYKSYKSSLKKERDIEKPAAVLETEWLMQQTPEVQDTHKKLKRGERLSTAEKLEYDRAKAEIEVKTAKRKAEASLGVSDYSNINKAGKAANKTINTVKRLKGLSKKAFAGTLAEQRVALSKMGNALGLDIEGVSESEQMQAISNELVLDKSQQMSGALSNADMDFLRNTAPTLTQTRDGREKILDYADMLAKREKEYAKQSVKFKKENGYFDLPEFQQQFDQWAEENPLFDAGKTQDSAAISDEDLLKKYGG